MRIAILSTYPPAHCGIGTYSSYLCSGLKKIKGTKIFILTEKTNPKVIADQISVIPCYNKKQPYKNDFMQKINEINPAIVHIEHEFGLFGWDSRLFSLLAAMKSAGVRIIITLHTCFTNGHTKKSPKGLKSVEDYYRKIGRLVDRIIVHQKECKTVMVRTGIAEDKISVISHGTTIHKVKKSAALRKRLGLRPKAKIVMYFGFFKDVKMTPYFIDALPGIFKAVPHTYFYIVGSFRTKCKKDKMDLRNIKARIRRLKIGNKIIIINKFVDEDEVPLYMASADVVVYPYDIEYWGDTGSAHRAIGAGAILAVSRIPKFDEIRSEIYEEIAVLPHQSKGWQRVIVRLLTDEKFRKYVAKKTEIYAEKTSWDNIAKQHYDVYKSVLNK